MDRPLLVEEWSRHLKSQKASRAVKSFELVLASIEVDAALARSVKMRRTKGRVELVGRGNTFGTRLFPPAVKSVSLARAKRVEFQEPIGLRPKHLDFRALPKELPKALRQLNRIRRYDLELGEDMGLPSNVFSPDDRYTFADTAFPWSTCGRVDTAAGFGSGVMIGPRHLLTASHVVNWGPNNTAGWLKFTPLFFDGNEPFGRAPSSED
jgi:V8-like Glu-specific endopeptidase